MHKQAISFPWSDGTVGSSLGIRDLEGRVWGTGQLHMGEEEEEETKEFETGKVKFTFFQIQTEAQREREKDRKKKVGVRVGC